jgi:patatin-like phospholipase/acyl hydrolase
VDGGVFANNPTLNGIIEAKNAFNLNLSDLPVLSIGTGHQRFCDAGLDKKKKQSIP